MTGDIVITIVVKPLRGGKRPIIVSAAPAGEMPLILTGHFPERLALVDQVYQELLMRKPKIVKVAASKKVAAKKDPDVVEPKAPAAPEAVEPETAQAPAPEPKPDQLVRPEPEAQMPLPTIEGDAPHGSASMLIAEADALVDSLAGDTQEVTNG